jgi:hypothetical protein
VRQESVEGTTHARCLFVLGILFPADCSRSNIRALAKHTTQSWGVGLLNGDVVAAVLQKRGRRRREGEKRRKGGKFKIK